jgi:hypothetical protein
MLNLVFGEVYYARVMGVGSITEKTKNTWSDEELRTALDSKNLSLDSSVAFFQKSIHQGLLGQRGPS